MPSIFRGSVTLHSALLLVALWGSKEIFFHQRSWEMKWTFNNLSPVRFGQLLFINRSDADSDCLVTFMSIHRTGKAEAVQDLSVNLPQFPEHNFSVYQREKNFTSMCVVCYITICCCKWMVWGSRQTVICHLPLPPPPHYTALSFSSPHPSSYPDFLFVLVNLHNTNQSTKFCNILSCTSASNTFYWQ